MLGAYIVTARMLQKDTTTTQRIASICDFTENIQVRSTFWKRHPMLTRSRVVLVKGLRA